jgi:D-alanyl-D-alanine carboxypeptidase
MRSVLSARICAVAAVAIAAFVAPIAAGAPLEVRLSHALHVPHVSSGASAAVALDLTSGEAVYSHNASLSLLPASNEKLAVTYAALTALGPAFRIETDVLGEGEQEADVWRGDVVLKGYGDPTLSSADLAELARQVRADGIDRVDGRVVGDATWFDARQTSPGWKAAFYIHESPPLSALIVDRARVGRRSSRNPPLAAAQLFERALARAGVRVRFGARLGTADPGATRSHPSTRRRSPRWCTGWTSSATTSRPRCC